MIKYLKSFIRQWIRDSDVANPMLPSAEGSILENFEVGELVPLKGVMFRVGRVVGGDVPVLLLSPTGPTHGAKLQTLRDYRDEGRAHLGRQMLTRKALEKAWRRDDSAAS